MSRIKLKCGGKPRHKAIFGADGAITAAATIAAAGITAAATAASAKQQAKAIEQSAKTQSNALIAQNENANTLQKEQLAFTRSENKETRQQQQDIQTTLQMLAGQQNMNDIMQANRMQVKYGGKGKRKKLKSQPSYGGGSTGFKVTDGGDVVPIQIYPDGGILYEVIGNDHEHYHKISSGKNKTGVGIKFNNGNVVEAEGNQNTDKGELMYVTPEDAVFISKHSIKGYNPREAVEEGAHPLEAYNAQELIKELNGYNDDGTKAKYGKGSYRHPKYGYIKPLNIDFKNSPIGTLLGLNDKQGGFGGGRTGGGGYNRSIDNFNTNNNYKEENDTIYIPIVENFNDAFNRAKKAGQNRFIFNGNEYTTELGNNPNNNAVGRKRLQTIGVIPYVEEKEKNKKRSLKKCGGRPKADLGYIVPGAKITNLNPYNTFNSWNNRKRIYDAVTGKNSTNINLRNSDGFWNNYGGATLNSIGNLLGAGLNIWANQYAGHKLNQAYMTAGEKMRDAYSQMKGIDMSVLNREDFEAPHTLAVVRGTNTNINPQLQHIKRDAESEKRAVNRGTLSSAARLTRMAEINDRLMQRTNEQYAYKDNADEQIRQGNAERITQTAQANADRDIQARQNYANQYLALLQYNNQIENTKIAGMAQAESDALTQTAGINANAFQSSMSNLGSALTTSAGGFSSVYDGLRKTDRDRSNLLMGVDTQNMVNYLAQNPNVYGNKERAMNQIRAWRGINNPEIQQYIKQLQQAYGIA